ncbi:MAG: tRNA pseudouridine55 synthase [Myxococcota bacterium]
MTGVLLVDKPAGMTSTDVVRRARKVFNTGRVGHAGTLDPDATGLLIVCVGEATKAVPFLVADQKTYTATGRLGLETWTDDAAGDPFREAPWDHVTDAQIDGALEQIAMRGEQVPPRISAIKRNGERMYERARRGEDVELELEPRPVDLHRLTRVPAELPDVAVEMVVGKGFYVRSLFRDLGRIIDSAAHVLWLRRTTIGPFLVDQAVAFDDIGPESLLSIEDALAHLPAAILDDAATTKLGFGQRPVVGEGVELDYAGDGPIRAMSPDGKLVAMVELTEGTLKVIRGFTSDRPAAETQQLHESPTDGAVGR